MSIRAGTMSSSYSPSEGRPGFFRKLVTLIAFVTGISGFMVLINYYQTNLSPLLMTIFALLGIGLAAGAGARTVFYEWSGFVRFCLTLAVLLLGLFVLGFFTNWRMGIGPLEPWIAGVIDWNQLIRLGCAWLVAILSLEAWWNPAPKSDDGITSEDSRTPMRREPSPARAARQAVENRPVQIQAQPALPAQPNRPPRLKFMSRPRTRSRTAPRSEKLILGHLAQNTRSRSRRPSKRKPNLQISTYEDHRCPFCLEEVRRNDPRGVRKCEVCNTLHHADCWEITGFCQVPHLNT